MIHTVFLDLDETLLDFRRGERAALAAALTQLGIPPAPETLERYSTINAQQWQLLERGLLTREEILVRRFDLLFGELGVERSSAEARDLYEGLLRQQHDFLPGGRELLETLAPHYDLYIASNGTAAVQDQRIADAGIAAYCRDIFISQRLGAVKPQKEFFDACFARIPGFCPEEAIIIGDSLTSDIQGGLNAGLHTCWFNPHRRTAPPDIRPEYQVQALEEIPALLASIP